MVHQFPKESTIRRQWVKFVQTKRANFDGKSQWSVLCEIHFSPECYEDSMMVDMGFKKRKTLKKGAVPTIHVVPPPDLCKKDQKKRQTCSSTSSEPSSTKRRRSRAVAKLEVSRVSTKINLQM